MPERDAVGDESRADRRQRRVHFPGAFAVAGRRGDRVVHRPRARVRPEFTVTHDDTDTVVEICRRLDGMPLAIELAAARVRALSLGDILGSLHDRFRPLTGGARKAVRRQQTLHASVDCSHTLLTEPERILFRRLAAFAGGFDLDAAQSVCASGDVERYQVMDQLTLLVDKSLVVAENTGGRTRYRLLETVRQYASEKLGESGEADEVRYSSSRPLHRRWRRALDAPAVGGHEERLQQAEVEIDNLRAAFAWSRENDEVVSGFGAGILTAAAVAHPRSPSRGHRVAGRRPRGRHPGPHRHGRCPVFGRSLTERISVRGTARSRDLCWRRKRWRQHANSAIQRCSHGRSSARKSTICRGRCSPAVLRRGPVRSPASSATLGGCVRCCSDWHTQRCSSVTWAPPSRPRRKALPSPTRSATRSLPATVASMSPSR